VFSCLPWTKNRRIGSTENTEDTENTKKNSLHPSVFFRVFRGQKIRVYSWFSEQNVL
ncbi:MAG: hypothetical protein, partial [Olavius algarvensis Gamma 1 endosymbiont]